MGRKSVRVIPEHDSVPGKPRGRTIGGLGLDGLGRYPLHSIMGQHKCDQKVYGLSGHMRWTRTLVFRSCLTMSFPVPVDETKETEGQSTKTVGLPVACFCVTSGAFEQKNKSYATRLASEDVSVRA